MPDPRFPEPIPAVLPCVRADFPRARLLLRSLSLYKNPFSPVYLVCPSSQVLWFKEQLQGLRRDGILSESPLVHVLDETFVVPELNHCWWLRGWMKQQLIKLAIAHHIDQSYYVTFDADVTLTRDTTALDFLVDDKAVYTEMHVTPHTNWYRGSARVLGIATKADQREHNVTPALLSRGAVLLLAEFLEKRAQISRSSISPLHLFPRWILSKKSESFPTGTRTWTLYLAAFAQRPLNEWTEYSLYYRFLEDQGLIQQFHRKVECPIYDNTLSVRKGRPDKFDTIDWRAVFQQGELQDAQRAHRPFVIVQSVAHIPLSKIEDVFCERLGIKPLGADA